MTAWPSSATATRHPWCDVVYSKLVEPGQQSPGFLFETPEGFVLLRETDGGVAKVAARTPEELARQFKIVEDISLARAIGEGSTATGPESFTQFVRGRVPERASPAFKSFLQNPANWKPERATVHREMVDAQLEKTRTLSKSMRQALGKGDGRPTLLLLRGNTASGKTTSLKKGGTPLLADLKADQYLEALKEGAINPDQLKYQLMVETPGSTSSSVHEEGSNLADRVIDKALAEGLDFVIDKRFLSVSSVEPIARAAKAKGYRVLMLDVDVGLESSASRLLWREPGTSDPNVPFEAVAHGFKQARSEREAIAGLPLIDGYELVTTDGAHSTLVASKTSGGPLTVRDPELWQKRTTVPPGEVENAADRLRHVVDMLSTVGGDDYHRAAKLKTWLPRVPFEVPRWESFMELDAHDSRKPVTPIETSVPRELYDAFVKEFQEKNGRAPSHEELIRFARAREADIAKRIEKFFWEVRRGSTSQAVHAELAQALKEHFESSFPGVKAYIQSVGHGYQVIIDGLGSSDQTRVFFDHIWEAQRGPGAESVAIATADLGPNELRIEPDPKIVHGPGFWRHSEKYPYLSPHQIVRRYGGTLDYLKDLQKKPDEYVNPLDPMLIDFQPPRGQEFEFSRFQERRQFSDGFRSDEPAAYHAGAQAMWHSAFRQAKVVQASPHAVRAREHARAMATAAQETAKESNELAEHALTLLANSKAATPKERWKIDETIIGEYSRYMIALLMDHQGGVEFNDPYDFNTTLDTAEGGRILYHSLQLKAREGSDGAKAWEIQREKAEKHFKELKRANQKIIGNTQLLLNELQREPLPGQTSVLNLDAFKSGGFVKAPLKGAHRRIMVLPGTFDPIHEGHVESALQMARELGFDVVVLTSNPTPDRKPGATPREARDKMVAVRVPESPGLNAFFFHESQGPLPGSGKDVIDRIKREYGTDQVYSVIGDDVYLAFKARGKFEQPNGIEYIVALRGPDSPLKGVTEKPANVTFFDPGHADSLSSTKVRQRVKDGQPVPPEWVHPAVERVMREEGLYLGTSPP